MEAKIQNTTNKAVSTGQRGKLETTQEIKSYIRTDYPILYLYTVEERKVMDMIESIAEENDTWIYTFDACDGLQCIRGKDQGLTLPGAASKRKELSAALRYVSENITCRAYVVLKDPQHLFVREEMLVRALKNCLFKIQDKPINFMIVSSSLHVPPELDKETVVIDVPFPTREEIMKILDAVLEEHQITPGEAVKERFARALNGLTEEEVRHLVHYCVVDDGALSEQDIEKINAQKRQITKKGGILEFVEPKITINDVGGLFALKEWLKPKKKIFAELEEARKYGVDIPKGLLLVGMPGCGKSLAAKAIGSYFEMPILRMDMGAIMGPYLGQSEENIRKAIKLAESVAPSILWIDEPLRSFLAPRKAPGLPRRPIAKLD